MKIINKLRIVVLSGLITAFFSGCASMQSMSSYARTGDTVSIALGGTEESNALVEVLKKEDIAIIITDSSGNSFPVTLRKLFRVYPDHASQYVYDSWDDGASATSAYTPPLLGQWVAIVELVDPDTGLLPALAIGQAFLSVSSVGQIDQDVLYSNFQFSWENGSLGSIEVEIIAGQGAPSKLNYVEPISYDPVNAIEPLPQIIVAPSDIPLSEFAGGSFTFVYNQADFDTELKAVPANHDPNIQLMSSSIDLGDGTTQINVSILNPRGFLTTNKSVVGVSRIDLGGSSPFRSARFNLIWKKTAATIVTDQNWQNSIQMTSGSYIDLQGNLLVGINPVMKKVR
ncbi:hypothetical protein MNBD_GAMMA10-1262 [hydrothermal vent metagenome]|uniref:Lipoprotein n=1 Tax=hydrothermal vent metagenome TaxID=652676 RepID=A0A3B0XIT1_9ZZZZ